MVGYLLRLRVKPGKMQQLSEFLAWDAKVALESEPGTLRFDVYTDSENADCLVLYELYESAEAFDAHKANEPFQKFGEIKEECIESIDLIADASKPIALNL